MRLQRIEDADEDAPNEFIDEVAQAMRQKLRNRLQFDDSRVDRIIRSSGVSSEPANFILDDEYDPNEPFSEFKFRSFKKDRQIKQDYTLIDIEDPEDLSTLVSSQVYPDSLLNRDSVELVGIDQQQLIDHEKELLIKKKEQEKATREYLKGESKFIDKNSTQTKKDLRTRKNFLQTLIIEKQKRSKAEFEMKKDVLTNSFKASVDSLISRVKKQKDLITASYGPIILNSKKN